MLREVMEAEVSAAAGADWYERSTEREAHRNGYRQPQWDTRVGTVELPIPRLRLVLPSFLEPWRRPSEGSGDRLCRARQPARKVDVRLWWSSSHSWVQKLGRVRGQGLVTLR